MKTSCLRPDSGTGNRRNQVREEGAACAGSATQEYVLSDGLLFLAAAHAPILRPHVSYCYVVCCIQHKDKVHANSSINDQRHFT